MPDDLLDGEQGKVTVADLVEKAEEEKESESVKEDKKAEEEKNGVEGETEEEIPLFGYEGCILTAEEWYENPWE